MEYHLSKAGVVSGPHSQFFIIERIRDGSLKGDELVWRLGSDWVPLNELNDFASYWAPPEEEEDPENTIEIKPPALSSSVSPWLRFWARMLDYLWYVCVLAMILGTILPQSAVVWIWSSSNLNVVINSLLFLTFVPVEAFLLSRFGTTPGKALLKISVRHLDGNLPSFSRALFRSFQVYIKGVALWLPMVNLFAMTWSRIRLLQKGVTTWDESSETQVEHGKLETWRYVTLIVIFLIIAGVMMISLSMSKELLDQMHSLPK